MCYRSLSRISHLAIAGLMFFVCARLFAQTAPSGEISGRVFDTATGRYLENAKVTVEGYGDRLTDDAGYFRFVGVPAGTRDIRAYYTGLGVLSARVTVTAGGKIERNLQFGVDKPEEPMVLDAFVVSVARETDGAALAINEQRVAPNIKNVVSTNEYGENVDGDIEQFVKFVPGVMAGEGSINIRSLQTTIDIDGNRVASAINSTESRTVGLEQLMLQNISRIEITKVPTPDRPADAIGGTVNLITKSAFERKDALFSYRTFLEWRGGEPFNINKVPGMDKKYRFTTPGIDLSWIVPVNNKLGFTATVAFVESSSPAPFISMDWVPTSGYSGTVTPAPAENPYLKLYTVRDQPRIITRKTAGFTVDYRLTPYDIFKVGFTYTLRDLVGVFQGFNADVGSNVVSWTPTSVQGGLGRGNVSLASTANTTNGESYQPTFSYRHNGKVWKFDSAASYAYSREKIPHGDETGRFNGLNVSLTGLTINYDKVGDRHADVLATTSTGGPIDIYSLKNYKITNASEATRRSYDTIKSARASLEREFNVGVPVTIRFGSDVRSQERDIRRWSYTYNFVGADGVANTADDAADVILDENFSKRESPWKFPQLLQYASPIEAYTLFKEHPSYFRINNVLTPWQSYVNSSKSLEETVATGFIRADTYLFNKRVWLVGGVRYEHTKDEGYGPLIDRTRVPAGVTDPVLVNQYTYVERGSHSKTDYGNFFPSLNLAWNITPNLILRSAYGRTISRPELSSILPGANLPDPSSTSRTITLTNTTLKPWIADNFDLNLEYYFKGTGNLSIGVFRKNIKDFIGSVTLPVSAELLLPYGIDPLVYSPDQGYVVSTSQNVGDGQVTGVEFGYKQTLPFIPKWAGVIQLFASYTHSSMSGDAKSFLLSSYWPDNVAGGFSWVFKKFNLDANVSTIGKHRVSDFTGAGVPAGSIADNYQPKIFNLTAGYTLNRYAQLFFTARDIKGEWFYQRRYSADTPEYAKFRSWTRTPALFAVGVKGTF